MDVWGRPETLAEVKCWGPILQRQRSDRPVAVEGDFDLSVEVYTVARKGHLTRVGTSNAQTWESDPEPRRVMVPDAPRVLLIWYRHGNSSRTRAEMYE